MEKAEYKRQIPQLRLELLRAQRALRAGGSTVLILIAGMDGAGKGEVLNLLYEWMDPHYLRTHAFGAPTEEERERPFFWRFWRTLPAAGTVGLYVGAWYGECLARQTEGSMDERALDHRIRRIRSFEKLLSDDSALIVKLWLDLSKEAQTLRLRTLAGDPETAWRVTALDWRHLERYDAFRRAADELLRGTDSHSAPWTLIDASDRRRRNISVGAHLLERFNSHLGRTGTTASSQRSPLPVTYHHPLRGLDLSQKLPKPDYRRQLAHYRGRLGRAAREAVHRKISSIVVLEGRDAAGKGGIIRRLLPALDARLCRVIPVGPPIGDERAHHYLWRFWQHIPWAGRVTIYDRSWYGRVLVERVEGLASEQEWIRAYGEINDFEEQLTETGIVLLKFWLEISPDEQLKRFRKRERVPFKRYKITDEDYRNRARWADYERAAEEMISRTGTPSAPWTLIEGEDKRFARIKALKAYCEGLEAALQ